MNRCRLYVDDVRPNQSLDALVIWVWKYVILLRLILLIIAMGVGIAVPIVVLVVSVLDAWRATGRRIYIILQGIAACVVWFAVSWAAMFIFYLMVVGSADSAYRLSHSGAANPSGADDPTTSLMLLFAIYALLGGCFMFVFWRWRRATFRDRIQHVVGPERGGRFL